MATLVEHHCGGHFRFRGHESLTCNRCGMTAEWSDFEDVYYCPQNDLLMVTPNRTLDVQREVRERAGYDLGIWHTGGGCFALGHTLPNGNELMVGDADGELPGDDPEWPHLWAGIVGADIDDIEIYYGDDIEDMADAIARYFTTTD